MKTVRIGNGCGFWGDNLDAPVLLAEQGQLDYLTLDYLAELTMSILAQQKERDPAVGYATAFLEVLARLAPAWRRQPQLRIITNAGGMNPLACAVRARALLRDAGLGERKIALVAGDDLLPRLDALLAEGHALAHLDSGEPLAAIRPRVVSANAYLGAAPIVTALEQGASLVITGRVADASLTLAPAVFTFGWRWDDWDRLASGTVAGHLLECGAQATGGLWCAWESCRLEEVGYPIAEIAADGTCRLSKPAGSGGAVNCETVAEQLLYEVGDPAAYLTPDVIADFTSVQLCEVAPEVVEISPARGRPATEFYKVSIAYRDGFTAAGTLLVCGPQALAKAEYCSRLVWERLRRAGALPEEHLAEYLGAGSGVPRGPLRSDVPEVVLRLAVRDSRRAVVERFTKELAPLVTSGPPGVTGYTGGRAPVREVFAYWPALLAKQAVTPEVSFLS